MEPRHKAGLSAPKAVCSLLGLSRFGRFEMYFGFEMDFGLALGRLPRTALEAIVVDTMPSIDPAQHTEIIEHLLGSLGEDADGMVSSEKFDGVRDPRRLFWTVSHVTWGCQLASPPMRTVASGATYPHPPGLGAHAFGMLNGALATRWDAQFP